MKLLGHNDIKTEWFRFFFVIGVSKRVAVALAANLLSNKSVSVIVCGSPSLTYALIKHRIDGSLTEYMNSSFLCMPENQPADAIHIHIHIYVCSSDQTSLYLVILMGFGWCVLKFTWLIVWINNGPEANSRIKYQIFFSSSWLLSLFYHYSYIHIECAQRCAAVIILIIIIIIFEMAVANGLLN